MHLLHLVVATLSSIQTLVPPQAQVKSGSSALPEQALKAAAMGAGQALRTEPVSPIDRKALMKALRYSTECCSCSEVLYSHKRDRLVTSIPYDCLCVFAVCCYKPYKKACDERFGAMSAVLTEV